jgi:hypothetical protein
MCRQELNLAVQHMAVMLNNCRFHNTAGAKRVAKDLKSSHGAILSASHFLDMSLG